jgi:hypothetical protein
LVTAVKALLGFVLLADRGYFSHGLWIPAPGRTDGVRKRWDDGAAHANHGWRLVVRAVDKHHALARLSLVFRTSLG